MTTKAFPSSCQVYGKWTTTGRVNVNLPEILFIVTQKFTDINSWQRNSKHGLCPMEIKTNLLLWLI